LPAAQVYGMAVVCLAVGLGIGYLFRDSQVQAFPAQIAGHSASQAGAVAMGGQGVSGPRAVGQMPGGQAQSPHGSAMGGKMPSLADMKQMADSKAAPLLEKLKKDPNNTGLLDQVGAIYHSTHQFKEAAVYYDKAVQLEPKNVGTKLAISLYRGGDVDGALAQLNRSLSYDPKDANSLFDLGMIKLQGRHDSKGALAAWQQLLKSNPQLSAERRDTVEKLMASVKTTAGDQHAAEGVQSK
jgi:cytochrome c-type biogenesis protein CcmH/NrfG